VDVGKNRFTLVVSAIAIEGFVILLNNFKIEDCIDPLLVNSMPTTTVFAVFQ